MFRICRSIMIAALVAMFAAATPVAFAADPPAPAAAPAKKPAGKPEFPTLSVATLDGATFDLAQQRGKWVVVNFWATWCGPCIHEIPELSKLDAARDDVQVIGLAYDEVTPEDLRKFLAEHPAGYPIAIIDVYAPPKDFETPRGLPMTVLVAPDGKVAKQFLGPVTAKVLTDAIAAATPAAPDAKAKPAAPQPAST